MNFSARLFQAVEGIGIALDSIKANRVRAGLTIMGVALGVFVVVALSSVVRGINESFARDIAAAGPTSFFMFPRPIGNFEICDGTDQTCTWRRNPPLTIDEVRTLERLPSIQTVTAHMGWFGTFKYHDRQLNAGMDAYTSNWTDVDGGDIYPGRSFTEQENVTAARVAIVNDLMAEKLFGDSDPLGKNIDINSVQFTVIGVYHHSASPIGTPTSGSNDSPKAIVPLETGRRQLGFRIRWINLLVKPRPGVTVPEATDDVIGTMRAHRGLRPTEKNNFEIVTQDRMMQVYDKLFGTFFVVGLALSSVGLMVGGVGVVAIMMISVTERTREIGVRKALGATRAAILWQFLVEAVTLTSIGATIGLLLGIGLALGVNAKWPSIPASTPMSAVLSALAASGLTGVFFGLLPAMRAARLDPVAALRHE